MRTTCGNRFIPGDAGFETLLGAIRRGLHDLADWWDATGDREIDLGAITVTTTHVGDRIGVTVEGDPRDAHERDAVDAATGERGGER